MGAAESIRAKMRINVWDILECGVLTEDNMSAVCFCEDKNFYGRRKITYVYYKKKYY